MIVANLDKFIENVITNRLKKHSDITTLFKALDKTFPDRWEAQYKSDITLYKSDITLYNVEEYNPQAILEYFSFYLEVLIYFPEIEITNGRNKHTITDLYVKLSVRVRKFDTTRLSIEGARTSFTLNELSSQYCHSHLPSGTVEGHFDNFCLGIGPIQDYLRDINRPEEEWLFFLTLLNQYLRWESISGHPYRYLNQIGSYGELPKIPEYVPNQILKSHQIKNIKHRITDTSIEVIPSEAMEEDITNQLLGTVYEEYLCYKNPDGEYLSETQILPHKSYSKYDGRPLFTFKGELKKFKILNERKNEQSNFTRNAPVPDLTKKLCEELSDRLTKAYIKRGRVKSEDTSKSTQECSREDEVLVLSHT